MVKCVKGDAEHACGSCYLIRIKLKIVYASFSDDSSALLVKSQIQRAPRPIEHVELFNHKLNVNLQSS